MRRFLQNSNKQLPIMGFLAISSTTNPNNNFIIN